MSNKKSSSKKSSKKSTGYLAAKNAVNVFDQNLVNALSVDSYDKRIETFTNIMRQLSTKFCSSPKIKLYTLSLYDHDELCSVDGSADLVSIVNNFDFMEIDKYSLEEMRRLRRGVGVVSLLIRYAAPGLSRAGHATIFVFDAYRGIQHYFNPWGFEGHWLSKAFANRPALVNGYRPGTVQEDAWPTVAQSLQGRYDKNILQDGTGNCVVYCLLVAVLCMRFGKGDPKAMANLYMSNYNHMADPGTWVLPRLWAWMTAIQETLQRSKNRANTSQQREEAREELDRVIFPPRGEGQCGYYSPALDSYCKRKPCRDKVFCWQHRYYARNRDAEGDKKRACKKPQEKCQAIFNHKNYVAYMKKTSSKKSSKTSSKKSSKTSSKKSSKKSSSRNVSR